MYITSRTEIFPRVDSESFESAWNSLTNRCRAWSNPQSQSESRHSVIARWVPTHLSLGRVVPRIQIRSKLPIDGARAQPLGLSKLKRLCARAERPGRRIFRCQVLAAGEKLVRIGAFGTSGILVIFLFRDLAVFLSGPFLSSLQQIF